jgi:hypothetical protein
MNTKTDHLLPRLAQQLLIRREAVWSADEARKAVVAPMMMLQVTVPPADFRRLIACVYRVGKTLDPLEGLYRSVRWDIAKLRESLQRCLDSQGIEADSAALFIESLAATVKGYDFTAPQSLDWVHTITRLLRHCHCEKLLPELKSKLLLADFIHDALEQRRMELVAHAEVELDITTQQIADALASLSDVHESKPTPPQTTPSHAVERLTPTELDGLTAMVHPRAQTKFREWIERLNPVAQQAMLRKLTQLQNEPLVQRLWVKPILGTRLTALRELKVITNGTHYRLLFQTSSPSHFVILAFGLRRDLESLIDMADTLAIAASHE